MSIFKACDVRGIYGKSLTEKEAYSIGRAVGHLKAGNKVAVGGDVRLSTPSLKTALIDGLTRSGADVIDFGIVPTPAFYYAKHKAGIQAGVMVTASHNPPEFNGFKITLGDLPITEDELQNIRQLSQETELSTGHGSITIHDPIPDYWWFIAAEGEKILQRCKPTAVVVDCGNGCYSGIAPSALRHVGLDVVELFCEPDGTFPNRPANSAVPENLTALSKAVLREKADFGVAFDGDGDRVSFVDDRGRVISSDKAIVLFINDILSEPGEKVVHDIKCSQIVPEAVKAKDSIPLMERSGHTFIKTAMINENAVLGGEISGHIFHRALGGGDDGLYSALIMAGIVAGSNEPLSNLVDSVPDYAITPDIRIPFPHDSNVLEEIAAAFPVEQVSRLDGVRVDFGDGWGLARLSVTEPVITMRFEAHTEERLREIADQFTAPVPELCEKVEEKLERRGDTRTR